MNISASAIYNWTYGLYFDPITKKKISSQNILFQQQNSFNKITYQLFDLGDNNTSLLDAPTPRTFGLPLVNGIYDNDKYLDSARQFIKIPFEQPIRIQKLEFNSDLFENLTFSINENPRIPYKQVKYMEEQPTKSTIGAVHTFYDNRCRLNTWDFGSSGGGGGVTIVGLSSGAKRVSTGSGNTFWLMGGPSPFFPKGVRFDDDDGGTLSPGNNIPFILGEPVVIDDPDAFGQVYYISSLSKRLGGEGLMGRYGVGNSDQDFIPKPHDNVDLFLSCSPYAAYQPRVRVKTIHGELIIPIEYFYYDDTNNTIFFDVENFTDTEYTFSQGTINNVTEIILEGCRPFKKKLFGSNILPNSPNYTWGENAIINRLLLSDVFTSNRSNIFFTANNQLQSAAYSFPTYSNLAANQFSTVAFPINTINAGTLTPTRLSPVSAVKGYGSKFNYLELMTNYSYITDLSIFKAYTVNNNIYLSPETNITVDFNKNPKDYLLFRNIAFGNKQIDRLSFAYSKPISEYNKPSDLWINELLYLIYFRDRYASDIPQYIAKYFTIDDLEFIDIYVSESVRLSHINIVAESSPAPETPTPTPSTTSGLTPTPTPTLTPTPTEPFRLRGKVVQLKVNKDNDITPIPQDDTYAGVPLYFNRVFAGSDHAMVSREDKTVFPLFDNTYYQLGIQLPFNTTSIDKLNTIISSIDSRWKRISIANKFSYLIDLHNNLFRWGDNTNGQLASSLSVLQTPVKLALENTDKFIDVSTADDHAFIIDDKNHLYFTGKIYSSIQNRNFISYPSDNGSWVRVFTSNGYTFGIKTDNKLYLIRDSRKINSFFSAPIVIDEDVEDFIDISCGHNHLLIIKRDGSLWGFGNNDFYQLGMFENTETRLIVLDNIKKWTKIAAGARHSLAIDENSALYGWGDNTFEQFGIKNLDVIMTPTIIWSGNWIDIATYENLTLGIVDTLDVTTKFVTPTPTPTITRTQTSTPTPTRTQTPTPSSTVNPTPTSTATNTPTPSSTSKATPTPTPTKPYDFSNTDMIP